LVRQAIEDSYSTHVVCEHNSRSIREKGTIKIAAAFAPVLSFHWTKMYRVLKRKETRASD
jgi:hypothetical protein